ncbi:MAG: DUF2254 domain-containing protein [Deltaproteobacteria bacterium]|nr:DUF2254 domain-containing protein [Deltaproteobacteria bacterium]
MKIDGSTWRRWLGPMSVLSSLALVSFGALFAVDHYVTGGPSVPTDSALLRYLFFDAGAVSNAVPGLAALIAAVLGIVITVVSIVVQLTAERYHNIATMFFRDRTNVSVLGYYVVACVAGVLVSLSVGGDFVPRATVVGMMAATAVGLVLMAPYFAYVFWFLDPVNIIARIRDDAVHVVRAGAHAVAAERRALAQARVVAAMEELTDITSNSISGKDKIIASRAVDAIKDFVVAYVPAKREYDAAWFALGPSLRDNPDFVAMDPESRGDLEERRTWVEWKAMRQYLGIYNEALPVMPDIDYLIAIDTRYIGEAAAAAGDTELVELVFRYMNSYLRSTLNAKNVRTAYNVLNQYRLLVEAMLRTGQGELAAEAVGHLKYYGHVSYDLNLPFVTETVAYDISTACEVAHKLAAPVEQAVLHSFLELDRPVALRSQEQALKGVRKAQVKLAAYYLQAGAEDKARLIFHDMRQEPPGRLAAIRGELERVETKDFWEIIDRGRNFEFMPPAQKDAMRRFFAWFEAEGLTGTAEPKEAP